MPNKKNEKNIEKQNKKKTKKRNKLAGLAIEKANEEKAVTFLEAIDKYASQQREKIKSDAEAVKEREIKKAETEVLTDIYNMIQTEMSKIRAEIVGKVSEKEISCRRLLLRNRDQISGEVFTKAKQKLENFTKTEGYVSLISRFAYNASRVLGEENTVLYISENDKELINQIVSSFGSNKCKVELDKNIKIGGLRGYNQDKGIVIDETLDSKLEKQYAWFKEHSGLSVV